ncbi:hypothetical protein N658DRAFT_116040 [Parathielavia hyrcaniae]|uniref:PNPLA domain-containing protein n=1 Tax=Parathielavia hyrcaniae TaxID=113614 RepID=A0AAN6Q860_9PEZI|nr:hypothetical protein N658DRAFT_116040 [Parathielavia hyrcaniae]
MALGDSDENEAINLLSLDGGGVRGVSSLVILDQIMTRIKDIYKLSEPPKPCDLFHMIAGTSTGGLIAIMLGRLRMSTKEALEAYDNCAAKIFARGNRKIWSMSDKFQATALREVVERIVEERGLGEYMRDTEDPNKGKVIVCVMPSSKIGEPRFARSFYGDQGTEDVWDEGVKIWEAARATTAASSFFKPQTLGHGDSAQAYIDAAIGVNNPVDYLLTEAVRDFGSARRLGCIVSIGTGTRDVKLERGYLGIANLFRIIGILKNTATDGQETHRRLQSRLSPFPGSYYRFTVPDVAKQVGLHHYKKMPLLKASTAEYLAEPEVNRQIYQIAEGLEMDCFEHGLTLGHLAGLDKEQVLLATRAQTMGSTNSFFTGRQDIIQNLDSFFSARNTGGKPRRELLLHGLPGVGKTEVAIKFSEVFEDRFKYIFYIDGSMPATITQSYAQIAKRYNLGTSGTAEGMKNLAMRWMEELTDEWLMIFDDCKPNDRRTHLPARGKGNIIYTSRSTELRSDLPQDCLLEVVPFTEADAVDLLLKVSGRQSGAASAQDMHAARAIVHELGSLPLAIDKAAASIRDRRLALHVYLEQIRDRKVGILSDPRYRNRNVENPTVYATLELSAEAIMARRTREGRNARGLGASMALKVLSLLSFYHHQDFPAVRVFSRAAKERFKRNAHVAVPLYEVMNPPDRDFDSMLRVGADGKWDQHYFGVGLSVLESFSLVKVDSRRGTVSMHVLVHRWARHRLGENTTAYTRYSHLTRIMVTEAILVSWKWNEAFITRELDPHLHLCHARGKLASFDANYLAGLLLKLGWYYRLVKNFPAAEEALSRCLYLWRLESGSCSWNVINALTALGELYHEMGRLGEAELAYLEIINRIMGRIKDIRGEMGRRRGILHRCWRKASKAFPALARAQKTLSNSLPRRPSRGSLEGSLELTAMNQGPESGPEAKAVEPPQTTSKPTAADRDSDSDEAQESIEDFWVYHRLFHADLARVYMDQDRYGLGKRMLMNSLRFLDEEGHIPKDHAEYLRLEHEVKALTEPGNLQYWNRRANEMCELIDRGDSSFAQSDAYFQLLIAHANCVLKNGMWDLAYKHYCGALKLFDTVWGPCDRRMLEILRRMVDCLVEGDRCDEAVAVARKCVRRARRVYGQSHRETALALEKLYEALFFEKLEDGEEGDDILLEALSSAEEALGISHSITLRIRHRLQRRRRALKQPQRPLRQRQVSTEAEEVSSRWEDAKASLEQIKRDLGPNHIIVRRFARIVGDGPPKTKEEQLARVRACFGPHSSLTKRLQEELETERPGLAGDTERDREAGIQEARSVGSPFDRCACGEPAHAGGSKGREKVIAETSTETAAIPRILVVPPPEEAAFKKSRDVREIPDSAVHGLNAPSMFEDFKNEPIYLCGFYTSSMF